MKMQGQRIGAWPDHCRTLDHLLHFAVAFEKFTLAETPLERSAFAAQTPEQGVSLSPLAATIVNDIEHRRDGSLTLRRSGSR